MRDTAILNEWKGKCTSKYFFIKLLLVWSFIIIGANAALAQAPISGVVLDNITKEEIIGATVRVKDSNVGTATNVMGEYTLQIPASHQNGILVISYVGYITQEIQIKNLKTGMTINLVPDAVIMDDVVVVGYGNQRRSDVVGAISSISKDRLENVPVTDVVQLLQGSVAGLNLMSQTAGADPDSQTVMLIRGRNSISGSNDPLIVVDGVTFYGSISEISQNDIQDIAILKDASSQAIYGSRAANGVLLITTKQGVKGATKVTYDGYYSFQDVSNFPDLMTAEQYWNYKQLRSNKVYDEDDETTWPLSDSEKSVYKDGSYKNWTWRDLILRTGQSQRHQVSISGGGDKTTFNVSANLVQTKGIVVGNEYKKYSTRARINTTIAPWLNYDTSVSLTYIDRSGATPNFTDVFNKSPLMRPFNPDGSINIYPDASDTKKANPLENYLYDDRNRQYGVNTSHNLLVKIQQVKGLSYKLTFSAQYTNSEIYNYQPSSTQKGGEKNGIATTQDRTKYALLLDNLLTYQRDFNKHNIFLTALYSWEQKGDRKVSTEASNFPDDVLSWYNAQPGMLSRTIEDPKEVILSQMFRANYTYDSRYMASYTIRRDGYSGFGKDTKWGTFASGALAWNIHNESFFRNSKISDYVTLLKLRVSYGENGNMGVKPYSTTQQMKSSSYVSDGQTLGGYIPGSVGNPNLSWEPTRSMNIGLDFGLFKGRISGDVNVYRNNTRKLLLERTVSLVSGIESVVDNIGKTRNEGFEFSVSSYNISNKKFTWMTNFNCALIRTKILDLYGDGLDDVTNKWFIGKPIKVNYDYLHIGVWQLDEANLAAKYDAQPGYAKYDDHNNNGTYDMGDRVIIGSPEPNFTASLSNTFIYRDFSLSIMLYGVTGVKKSNPYKDNNYLINRNWWTETNPTNSFWSVATDANAYANGKSDKPSVYEKADYIRVKDITLSYTLPKKLTSVMRLAKLSAYISAKNAFTFTPWNGLDPELDTQRAKPLERELIFGLKLSL